MPKDSVIDFSERIVMYVAGDPASSIPDQASGAFCELESKLPSLKGRSFYGAILGNEYRACVSVGSEDIPDALPFPTFTLPGGKYVRRRIADWESNRDMIGPAFADLMRRPDVDRSRPFIEHYRSQAELLVMVPVDTQPTK